MNTPANLSNGCIVVRSLTHGETYAMQIPRHFQASVEEQIQKMDPITCAYQSHALEVLAAECVDSWAFEPGEVYTIALCKERDPGAARLSRDLVKLPKRYMVKREEAEDEA